MSSLESMAEAGAGLEVWWPPALSLFSPLPCKSWVIGMGASGSLISLVLGDRIAWRELCLYVSLWKKVMA